MTQCCAHLRKITDYVNIKMQIFFPGKKNPTWEESNEEILAKGQVCHLSIVESYPTSLKGQGKLVIFMF